jgi:hypothetical protein
MDLLVPGLVNACLEYARRDELARGVCRSRPAGRIHQNMNWHSVDAQNYARPRLRSRYRHNLMLRGIEYPDLRLRAG